MRRLVAIVRLFTRGWSAKGPGVSGLIVWTTLIGLSIIIWRMPEGVRNLRTLGYTGLFLIAMVSSMTFFLPGPSLVAVILAGSIYNPLVVGMVMGTGSALGELSGYVAGMAGTGLAKDTRVYQIIERWMRERGMLTLFVLAAVPNFFYDVAGLIAGITRYPVTRLLVVTIAGKIIRFWFGAIIGSKGVRLIEVLF